MFRTLVNDMAEGKYSKKNKAMGSTSTGDTVDAQANRCSHPLDINVYQQKKTLAQGMMDFALISANAGQLRYVLEDEAHPYYRAGIVLISTSLVLQTLVGMGLIWNARYNVKNLSQLARANMANNLTVAAIFLVTVINVFIITFSTV